MPPQTTGVEGRQGGFRLSIVERARTAIRGRDLVVVLPEGEDARIVAAAIEQGNDDDGIVWPAEVAPYAAHLVTIGVAKERELFMKLMTGTQSAAMRHYFFAERRANKIEGSSRVANTAANKAEAQAKADTMIACVYSKSQEDNKPSENLDVAALRAGLEAFYLDDGAEKDAKTGRNMIDVHLTLHEAMRYAIFAGGKRVRPFLVVESAALFGVPRSRALTVGAALECIHCYSLVHDDLPELVIIVQLERDRPYGVAVGAHVRAELDLRRTGQGLGERAKIINPRLLCGLATATRHHDEQHGVW